MKLSVVIVNFNHKYFPKLAIEALEKSKTNFDFQIVVVDNASDKDDESLKFLEKAAAEKRITLISLKKNIGFGQANNKGAEISSGEYIFFHNPDVIVEEDSLQKMIDYMGKHQDVGLLGPKLIYSSGEIQESCRRHMTFFDQVLNRTPLGKLPNFRSRLNKYLMRDFDHDKTQEVELLVGAAMMTPRHVFNKIGGFDKRYFLFMEDFDLCHSVRKAGYKVIYFADTQLLHYHKRLSRGSVLKLLTKKVFWLHVSSALKYAWKWRKIKAD